MKRINIPATTLFIVVFLAACASPTPAPIQTPASKPSASGITAQGEQIPFEICGESTSWTRPTEEEQKAKWWNAGRYASGDQKVVQYPWTHNFFVAYGHASGEYDVINLSGLWTVAGEVRPKCIEPAAQDAILKLQKAEVWALLHQVKSIRRLGSDYLIVIAPAEKGVQFVQFARPEQRVPLTLHFVTENGQELETIVEAESPYWPYPQLIPTRQP